MTNSAQTVICMKWGTAYGTDYANTLHNMVRRHTSRPLRFVCFTDNAEGLDPGIEPRPLPAINLPESHRWKAWRKIALTQADLGDVTGNVLFLDLDVVVTGGIDDFFDYAPEATYCVIENWTQMGSGIGNTSVFRLTVGAHTEVYNTLMADPEGTVRKHPNSQTFQSRTISSRVFWPKPWCVSFKHTLLPPFPLNYVKTAPLPDDAKVICFTGFPNPDHARDGIWPEKSWVKRIRKRVRPTPWIREHWQ
ncbi:glycosyl transferase [Acuticoccus kandeliae]|uniref:glycosyl transferase n=1 Tax=Acuticoccus kandeliae TaxID=2073160 RepID=UPI00196A71AA|nr:glycosyl transferase [Acuticoccus kandeliae]